MKNSYMQIAVLAISGLIAICFGGAILFVPELFYATYAMDLANDTSWLNETRASGGALLGIGLLIALGSIFSKLEFTSIIVSSAVYLSYGLSRLLSMAIDGAPGNGLVVAATFELCLGAMCLFILFRYHKERA